MDRTEPLNWYGTLTINNIERVVEMLRHLLTGRRYTFCAVNMSGNEHAPGKFKLIHRPDVRTGQQIKSSKSGDPFSVWLEDNYAGFNVGDTYGVWGCSTYARDERHELDYQNPYIAFEHWKVLIIHRAPAGPLLYWVIAIEPESDGD